MQTYVVLALMALAALYVAYVALRCFGLLGAPLGCGCGCETGCVSSGKTQKNTVGPGAASAGTAGALRLLTPAGMARHDCCGCGCGCTPSEVGRRE